MFKNTLTVLALFTATLISLQAAHATSLSSSASPAADKEVTEQATVSFDKLKNGDEVQSPFKVAFKLTGMKIAPSGTSSKPGTGHFHLLIDTKLTEGEMSMPIARDAQHLHFDGGQSAVDLNLPKGKHTLQIVMGNGLHKPHNPPVMSEVITITVK